MRTFLLITSGTGTNRKGRTKAQLVKNLPAMQETHLQSLDGEDPLEKEMAMHSRILPEFIGFPGNPMDRGAWRASSWGHKEWHTT